MVYLLVEQLSLKKMSNFSSKKYLFDLAFKSSYSQYFDIKKSQIVVVIIPLLLPFPMPKVSSTMIRSILN